MNFSLLVSLVLFYGVILVNGFTDAPNSTATAVLSGAISFKAGSILCGIFNLAGVIFGCFINPSVAKYVFSLGNFSQYGETVASLAFFVMISFSTVTYFLGIPSSESHAMLCAVCGASFALSKSAESIKNVGQVFVFMVFSCVLSLICGYLIRLILRKNFRYKKLQLASCGLSSFMHGWQGGLKFIGIGAFLLKIEIIDKGAPFFLILSVAFTMSLGAMLGGKRIISSLEKSLSSISHNVSFASDMSAYASLLICSLLGMPVSTGNVKFLSVLGAKSCESRLFGNKTIKQKSVFSQNKKTAIKLIFSFIAVFPICFSLGYLLMSLFL